MSSRAAKMLTDDMGAMGPVRLRDVDEAQIFARQPCQGPRGQGRDHDLQEPRRRGAGVLMKAAPAESFCSTATSAVTPEQSRASHWRSTANRVAEAEAVAYRKGFAAAAKPKRCRPRSARSRCWNRSPGRMDSHRRRTGTQLEARLRRRRRWTSRLPSRASSRLP